MEAEDFSHTSTGRVTAQVDTYVCSICGVQYDNPEIAGDMIYVIGRFAGYSVCLKCSEKIRQVCGIEIVK